MKKNFTLILVPITNFYVIICSIVIMARVSPIYFNSLLIIGLLVSIELIVITIIYADIY